MKIALMVPRLFPIPGGPEKLILNLADTYTKLGHDVYILTYEGGEKEFYSKFKFKVIFLPFIKTRKLKYLIKHLPTPFIIKKLLSIKPDVIHVHDTPFILSSMIYKKLFNDCQVILTSHYFFNKNSPRINRILFGLNLKLAANVASIGKQMQEDTKKIYGVDSILVPLCLNTNEFKKRPKKEIFKIKRKYRIPLDKKIILFVGRIVEQKNLELAISSIAEAVKKDRNILFVIVGSGEENYINSLIELADRLDMKKHIKMIGKVPEDDIVSVYSMGDLFLTTTIWETISISAIEALSCSLPVVSTDVGSMREVISDGRNGFLVNERNPRTIAEKILVALKNKKTFSSSARELIKKKFSLNVVSKTYLRLYEILIKSE